MKVRIALALLASLAPIMSSAQSIASIPRLIRAITVSTNEVRYGFNAVYSTNTLGDRVAQLEQLTVGDVDSSLSSSAELFGYGDYGASPEEIAKRMLLATSERQSWRIRLSEALERDVNELNIGDKLFLSRAFYQIVKDLDRHEPCGQDECELLTSLSFFSDLEFQGDDSWHLSTSNVKFKAIYDHFHDQRYSNEPGGRASILERCRPNGSICISVGQQTAGTVSFSLGCNNGNTSITVSTGDEVGIGVGMGDVSVSIPNISVP